MKGPKGFYVKLPQARYSYGVSDIERGISFQLKTDGVRYFFVDTSSDVRRHIRDISTQYRVFTRTYGGMNLGEVETKRAQERLVAHASEFYPDFVTPNYWESSFSWVAFPMIGAAMRNSGLAAPLGVNLQVANGLRALTVKDMTSRIFGEAPKQLQAAVASSLTSGKTHVNLDNLTLASILRGYIPPNGLAEVLRMVLPREGIMQQMDKHSANNIRLLLRRFSSQRIMRMVGSMSEEVLSDMLLRDAGNQYAAARVQNPDVVMDLSRQFRSLKELHETVTREFRKLQYANVEIPYSDERIDQLSSVKLWNGGLIWPSCTHELMEWASDGVMNNCIYSYGKEATAGKCLLLGVLDASGKMIINIMIRGKNVVQCYGPGNQPIADRALLESLFDGLLEADLIHPENDHETWLRRTYELGW